MPAAETAATPKSLGYRMPGEWAPHEAVWLSWPHDGESFPDLERVERTYGKIVAALQPGETVRLFVTGPGMRARAESLIKEAGGDPARVRFLTGPYADVWFRDYGPSYLLDAAGRRAMTRWTFNAWGGKYEPLMHDTRVPSWILKEFPERCFEAGVVMEGGSLDVDGEGTVLTTEQCLLNKNRNPSLSRADIEETLKGYLGAEKVLWLGEGVAGDDTDGHVDDIVRFAAPRVVVCAREEDPRDENHAPLEDNWRRLASMTDAKGRPLERVALPMPGPVRRKDGSRLPASYANFLIGTEAVIVPVFSHPNDEKALAVLRRLFPTRRVVGIECTALVHGLGTLHCISQQVPRAAA